MGARPAKCRFAMSIDREASSREVSLGGRFFGDAALGMHNKTRDATGQYGEATDRVLPSGMSCMARRLAA
jgi:hypothetical protein